MATAVSLKTESGDHYLFLYHEEGVGSVVDAVASDMGDELAYVYDISVATHGPNQAQIQGGIQAAIYAMEDEE
tara:strand:- start:308 stop:526 length:219 start_codon:yes stop_codon:yes gene_type:complete